MLAASQAVVDVLVRVPKVVEDTKTGHAFVIAKDLKGIFRIGDNPLSTDSPYLEEPAAIELMEKIMVGVQRVFTKHKDMFDKFVDCSDKIAEHYDSIMNSIKSFQNDPNDPDLLANLLAPDYNMQYTLSKLQSQLHVPVGYHKRYKPAITTVTKLCYKSASEDDPTWGFEAGCEFLSALLAVQRVAIEVMRRVMIKGGEYETQEIVFKTQDEVFTRFPSGDCTLQNISREKQ